jgi:hypothetical protein
MKSLTPGEQAKRATTQMNHALEQKLLKADYDLELIKNHFPSFDPTMDIETWPPQVHAAIDNYKQGLEKVHQRAKQAADDQYNKTLDCEKRKLFNTELALAAADDPD